MRSLVLSMLGAAALRKSMQQAGETVAFVRSLQPWEIGSITEPIIKARKKDKVRRRTKGRP